ncbi:dephospho-CoA kinase [Sulfurovum sp. bin170]|uniref:dephospho-CoA kinase n=1 Tax=Sulfurovum sp. bin170 TaxID=2695268 RepID=UPI0013E080FC|nr:dephospho-CoA kinase [Sulfurovum sp. bin170]NEW60075.1 dephospho-CoA kinase [Sulfurovum sp. bin170]
MKSFRYAVVLTGSISTGKSTVVEILNQKGFSFIDADRVAHTILDREYKKIAELFGLEYIIDSKVDRKALGRLIFANPKEKKKLEKTLHPLIYKEIKRQSKRLDNLKKPYIIDIPLFFETNRYPIEKSIVVYTPKEKQLERLIKRDTFSKEEAEQRIDSQIDIEIKREKATYLIDNSGDLNALQEECARVKEKILSDFR